LTPEDPAPSVPAEVQALIRAGRPTEAVMLASQALYAKNRVPHTAEDAELLRLLGVASLAIPGSPGQPRAVAASYFEQALALTPRDPRLLANLGQLAASDADPTRARDLYERALAEDPDDGRSIRGLARALAELGESERALELLARSPELKSELLRAQLLSRLGRYREVLSLLGEAVADDPAKVVLVGGALYELGAFARACALLERGYAAGDRSQALLVRLAAAREAVGDTARAQTLCDEAESRWGSGGRDLRLLRAKLAFAAGRVERAVDLLRATSADLSVDEGPTLLFFASHDARVGGRELFALHQDWASRARATLPERTTGVAVAPAASGSPSGATSDPAKRRLRVGYLSPDLREHVVMRFLRPVLDAHAAHGMDVVLLSIASHDDDESRDLRSSFPFVDLTHCSDAEARDLIRAQGLDVVVDLAGHSSTPRLGILLERTAPLVATYLGYPGTTGLTTVDLRISDADADPPETQRDFSERLAPLGRCAWAYLPRELGAGMVPPASRLPGPRRFGCFNRLCKWSNAQLELFVRVLEASPDAELLLRARGLAAPDVREGVADLFRARGVLARVSFSDWAPSYRESLHDYRTIDVALDTFPYAGTTTTCDALLMGVPVVTLVGDTPASRPGRSLLRAVGRPDLVTATPEDYVERATRALRERHLHDREALRATFLAGPLGDPSGLAAALRALFASELARRG
jgi:predicted O-linked N-acetylglucosamine transferase (SPINDLY family)/Tfp pilus assembly protein PilF